MSTGGARVGKDYLGGVQFVGGYEPVDLTGYTVTATHKHEGSTDAANVTVVTPRDPSRGKFKFFIPGGQITDPDADILVEFDISGSPTVNSPDAPLRISTRPEFGT